MPSSNSLHLWSQRLESLRRALKARSGVATRVLQDMVVFTITARTDPNIDVRAILDVHLHCRGRFVAICPPPWFYALDPQGEAEISTVRPSHTFVSQSGSAAVAAGLAFATDPAADDAALVVHVYVFDSEARARSWRADLIDEQVDQAVRNAAACLIEGVRGLELSADVPGNTVSEGVARFMRELADSRYDIGSALRSQVKQSEERGSDIAAVC